MTEFITDCKNWKIEQTKISRHAQMLENGLLSHSREGEFSVEQREFMLARSSNVDIVKKKLSAFKMGIQNIKSKLDLLKTSTSTYNPADIKKFLESFEAKLTSYKSTMRAEFDGLVGEEARLDADVQGMSTKIDEWELRDLAKPDRDKEEQQAALEREREEKITAKNSETRARTSDRYEKHVALQAKIGAIDRQIASQGGRYGGWDSRDHDTFLRGWVQSSSQTQAARKSSELSDSQRRLLLKRLVATVPLKTEEELEMHVEWYMRFESLNDSKHALLEEWKASRQKETAKKYKSSFSEIDMEDENASTGGGSVDSTTGAQRAEDKEAVRLRIITWKQEREAEKRRQEQTDKEVALLEKQRKEHELRKRQQHAQLKLDSWKKEEAACSETLQRTEKASKLAAARVTTADLAVRQTRDRELTQIQLARKEAAQDRIKARETKVRELAQTIHAEGGGVTATRDPERVLAATKAVEQHKNETETRADAQKRRSSTSAHRSNIAGTGRDLVGTGRSAAAWLSMK